MLEMMLRITPYHNLLGRYILEEAVVYHEANSVFISLPEVEHKSEVAGPLDIILSIRLFNLLKEFCQVFNIKPDQYVFCKKDRLPYKSTSALSSIVFGVTERLLQHRRIGPCALRKQATTVIRHFRPELAKDAAEFLQHSELVARDHYTASIAEKRKVEIGRALRDCMGLE